MIRRMISVAIPIYFFLAYYVISDVAGDPRKPLADSAGIDSPGLDAVVGWLALEEGACLNACPACFTLKPSWGSWALATEAEELIQGERRLNYDQLIYDQVYIRSIKTVKGHGLEIGFQKYNIYISKIKTSPYFFILYKSDRKYEKLDLSQRFNPTL